jgi:hypothetical protein
LILKTKILAVLILIIPEALDLFGQQTEAKGSLQYEDTLSLNPLHDFISIPNPENNIWKIGIPTAGILDSTFTGKEAIFAEAQEDNPNDTINCFYISIPVTYWVWGEGILSFYHYYSTDSLFNGGLLEISYDNGATWKNILDDIGHISQNFVGVYSENDTIQGGIPAYSGQSSEWVYTELYWWWIALTKKKTTESYGDPIIKFTFVRNTDPTDVNTWIIDGIVFRGYGLAGTVDTPSYFKVTIHPNPASNQIWVQLVGPMEVIDYEIYNLLGKKVYENQSNRIAQINISLLDPGIFILVAKHKGKIIARTMFLKN